METRTPYGNCSGCRISVGGGISSRIHQKGTIEHPLKVMVDLDFVIKCLNASSGEIALAAGETTAEERRTIKAVLGWIKRRIEEAA